MQYQSIFLATSLALLGAHAQAQTITNGDFSTGTSAGGSWTPTGWTDLATAAQAAAKRDTVYSGTPWIPYPNAGGSTKFNTAVSVLCDTACDGTLHNGVSQMVDGLTVGNTYAITFYTSGLHHDGTAYRSEQMGWDVSFGDVTQQGAMVPTSYQTGDQYSETHYQPWVATTLSFVATSSSELLSFMSDIKAQGAPTWSVLNLAGVSIKDVTPVPEPATLALMLGGLGALVLRARNRKG